MKESTLSLVLVLLVLLVLPAGFVLADDEEYFLEFDGDWDYVDLGSLDPQTSELTVSLWGYAKKGSLSETYRPLISWGNWNDDFTWYLRDDESKMYSLTVNGDNRRWAGSHDEVEGEWINWVIVIDDGSARVFENGEIIREEDYGVNSLSLANTLRIGVIRDDYYYWLNGMLDDVRIYDRALNESEINNLSENRYMELGDEVAWWPMNEIDGNTLLDKSENNNDGTIHGATWIRKSDSAIMITDWNDLDDVRDNLTATYALANDLDENTSGYDDVVGSDWESIQDFEGSFNGEGREIRDLDTSSDDATGLFSSIVNANISNVGLVNADIRGDEIAGGLVGTAENSSIDDCYISLSSVKGGKHIGGLVGETKKDSIVTASYAENTTVVGSDSKVGGLVGLSEDSSLIERSYVSGLDVEGDGTKTGGLLGYNNDVSTVVESYAKDTSVVGSDSKVGGLVGLSEDSSLIERSYVSGLDVEGDGTKTGGLLGYNKDVSTVVESYAKDTSVVGFDSEVGGLVGLNEVSSLIERSYVSGLIVEGDGTKTGGLLGYNDEGSTVVESYAKDTSVVGFDSKVGGLVGLNEVSSLIERSYVSGLDVEGDGKKTGGLLGYNNDEGSTVVESYAKDTSVVGSDEHVGGLVGFNDDSSLINRSYVSGLSVDGKDNKGVGGLVGKVDHGAVLRDLFVKDTVVEGKENLGVLGGEFKGKEDFYENLLAQGKAYGNEPAKTGALVGKSDDLNLGDSFWDEDASFPENSDGGRGLSALEMRDISSFEDAGWDIADVWFGEIDKSHTWNIINGSSYPFLSWQGPKESVDGWESSPEGDGTDSTPYQITTLSELNWMRNNLSASYVLGSHINASITKYWNDKMGWESIGKREHALEFDGDYTSLDDFEVTTNEITITAWVKADSLSDYDGIVFSRGTKVTGMNIYDGSLGYHWNDDSNLWSWSGPSIPKDKWVFLALSVRSDRAVAYVGSNKSLKFSLNNHPHKNTIIDNLKLGWDEVSGERHFNGLIDDVRVYDEALSEEEIQQLYENKYMPLGGEIGWWKLNEGSGTIAYDESENNNHGEIYGADWVNLTEPFKGSFDGQGYTISGLYINRSYGEHFGLFGVVGSEGIIENTGILGVNISANNFVGGLAGLVDGGTLNKSYATGNIAGDEFTGGLAGNLVEDGEIINSYSHANITGNEVVGGLVGGIFESKLYHNKTDDILDDVDDWITYYEETIDVRHLDEILVGFRCSFPPAESGFKVEIDGEIVEEHTTGSDENYDYTWVDYVNVSEEDEVDIKYKYQLEDDSLRIDWILHEYSESLGSIDSSYSTGLVEGSEELGGLLGRNLNGDVINSYWDGETSGQDQSAGGKELETVEMQGDYSKSNMEGFDFQSTWQAVAESNIFAVADAYPILQGLERDTQLKLLDVYEEDVVVRTKSVDDITLNSSLLGAELHMGLADEVDVWFEYRKAEQNTWNETEKETLTEHSEFTKNISELESATKYEFRAMAEEEGKIIEGGTNSFHTNAQLVVDTEKEGNETTYGEGTHEVEYNEEVELKANPATGWKFSNWTGDCEGQGKTCTLTMNESKETTAVFELVEYNLTVDILPEDWQGVVKINGTEVENGEVINYNYEDEIEFNASPDYGWLFVDWSGLRQTKENTFTEEMPAENTEITAEFEREQFNLEIIEDGGDEVNYGEGNHSFEFEKEVILNATLPGWEFIQWSGNCSGTEQICDLVITEDMKAIAHFQRKNFTLNLTAKGNGEEINHGLGLHEFMFEEEFNVEALPDPGWKFSGWTGYRDDDSISQDFEMPAENISLNAAFDPDVINVTNDTTRHYSGDNDWEDHWVAEDVNVEFLDEIELGYHFKIMGTSTGAKKKAGVRILVDDNDDEPLMEKTTFETEGVEDYWIGELNVSGKERISLYFQYYTDSTGGGSDAEIYEARYEQLNMEREELNVDIIGGGLTQPSEGTHQLYFNDSVELIAEPDSGWNFTNWTGDMFSDEKEFDFRITDTTNLTATFIDVMPPDLYIIKPENKTYDEHIQQLNFTAQDNDKVDECWYSANGGENNETIDACADGENKVNLTSEEGENNWTVWAKDPAGNIGNDSVSFLVDVTKPDINITSPTEIRTNVSNVFFEWGTEPGVSGLDWHEVKLESEEDWINVESNESYTFTDLDDGHRTLQVKAIDNAGNEKIENRTITVDTAPPEVELLKPHKFYNFSKENIEFSWLPTDNIAEGMNCDLILNGEKESGNFHIDNDTVHDFDTNINEGHHKWSVKCRDYVSNEGSSETRNFTVDTTPPEVEIKNPVNFYNSSKEQINFSWATTDNLAEDINCNLTINDELEESVTSKNDTLETAENVTLDEGHYNWDVTCSDIAGNIGSSKTYNLTIDTTPPEIELNNPVNYYNSSKDKISFSWTATDNLAEEMPCDLMINGAVNKSFNVTNATLKDYTLEGINQGHHNWSVNCTDDAGKKKSSQTRDFTIDTTPPEVELHKPINYYNSSSDRINFNWTATDNIAEELSCDLFINSEKNEFDISSENNSVTAEEIKDISNDHHSWKVNCTDDAGNYFYDKRNFTVDTIEPWINITYPEDGEKFGTNQTMANWDMEVGKSDLKELKVRAFDDWDEWIEPDNLDSHNFTDIQGDTELVVNATDYANNTGTASVNIFLDSDEPHVTITNPDEGESYSTEEIELTWSTNEGQGLEKHEVRKNDNEWIPLSNDTFEYKFEELAEGHKTFYVKATNIAGSNETDNVYVIIDRTEPEVTLEEPVNFYNSSKEEINFSWIAKDNLADEIECELLINNEAEFSRDSENNTLYTEDEHSLGEDGYYTWAVKCFDNAGNMGQSKTRNLTVDTKDPEIDIQTPGEGDIFNKSSVSVEWKTKPGKSGIKKHLVKVDEGDWENADSNSSNLFEDLVDGRERELHIKAIDNAGNVNTESITVHIDTEKPELEINYPENIRYDKNITEIKFVAEDNLDLGTCWYDIGTGKEEVDCFEGDEKSVNDITSTEGLNTWTVGANDTAGNRQTKNVEFEVNFVSWDFQVDINSDQTDFAFEVEDADVYVDFGDGNDATKKDTGIITNTYEEKGIYDVKIIGSASRVSFCDTGSDNCDQTTPGLLKDIITPIPSEFGLNSAENMFMNTEIEEFSVEDFFDYASKNVENMSGMFGGSSFNQDISSWNFENVSNMENMFEDAKLSTAFYDNFLIRLGEFDLDGVSLHGGYSKYYTSESIRNELFDNGQITDGGKDKSLFVSTWDTTKISSGSSDNNKINLPLVEEGNYDFKIDWGDGTIQTVTSWDSVNATHTYDEGGSYTITIDGKIDGFGFNNAGDKHKILDIEQWGNLTLGNNGGYFHGCKNLDISADDTPDLSETFDFSKMFKDATSVQGGLSNWNVSNVENMAHMFENADNFNEDIGDWEVGSVTNMESMFKDARVFNEDIGDWEVGSVTNMAHMFENAGDFNEDIGDWEVGSVTNMESMFSGAHSFNQDIGGWSVLYVENMAYMFKDAAEFEQDLGGWYVRNVESMEGMFANVDLTTANYDSLLMGWANYDLENNVVFDAGGSMYYRGEEAKYDILEDEYGWQISDGGKNTTIYFIAQWDTTQTSSGSSDNNQINLPLVEDGNYDFIVDWDDGTTERVTSWNSENATHTYSQPGTYKISLDGTIEGFRFNNAGDKEKIKEIKQWGNLTFTNEGGYFYGCRNLDSSATDKPDVSGLTNMSNMFRNAQNFNGNISNWDVGNVTDMSNMFEEAREFNRDLDTWDVSNVENMEGMFEVARSFNGSINNWNTNNVGNMARMFSDAWNFDRALDNWNVSNVEDMNYMFSWADSFNQSISTWDTGNVNDMSWMFAGTDYFNQELNQWNVSNVETLEGMFFEALEFDQNLDKWDVSSVEKIDSMFYNAHSFDGEIGSWDVNNVTTMNEMFYNALLFNQDISEWNTSNVEDISAMFYEAESFNQYIGDWDVSKIENMNSLFSGALSFNSSINSWNVSNVTGMSSMFEDATSFNQDINSWNVSNVTDMSYMFSGATSFNQDINSWDVSNTTDLSFMFEDATSFDSSLSEWNVSNARDMSGMFSGASSFNQDISQWNVNNVTDMSGMFSGAYSFNQDISGWDVSSLIYAQDMFRDASSFNSHLNSWNVINVTDMSSMFEDASSFNHNISNWSVKNVNDMGKMFSGAKSFSYNVSGWDVSNVENMNSMFKDASSFDSSMEEWNVGNVKDMGSMFSGVTEFNSDLSTWDVKNVRNTTRMFYDAVNFNQPIGNWEFNNLREMSAMFYNASSFNQDISNWDVSGVEDMSYVFAYANSFNQDLGDWDVSNVETMENMFYNVVLSTSNYDGILIGWTNLGDDLQESVHFHGGGSEFCAGEFARNYELNDTYSWTITDGGWDDLCEFSPVEISVVSPDNDTSTTDREPFINWTIPESFRGNMSGEFFEGVTYDINLTCRPDCDDDRFIEGIETSNYTLSELEYFYDNNYFYEWSIRSYDGINYGNWTEPRILKVDTKVMLSLDPSYVDIGALDPGGTKSTTEEGTSPQSIVNKGNCYINVTMQGNDYLWDTIDEDSDYQQFKIESEEEDSFAQEGTLIDWNQFTLDEILIINKLNYQEGLNRVMLHTNLTMPDGEPHGEKRTNFTLSGEYVRVD